MHNAAADQIAAQLRDARCCDAFDPCRPCQVGRMTFAVRRMLVEEELILAAKEG